MPNPNFLPRLLEAECEFWFPTASDPLSPVESTLADRLAQRLPLDEDMVVPWVWYEPNYLALRSELPPGGAAAHRCRLLSALTAYLEAARPQAVQSVFLRYLFSLPAAVLPGAVLPNASGPLVRVRQTRYRRLSVTVTAVASSSPPRVEVELRCLLTGPSRRAVTDTSSWLADLHATLEKEFQQIRSGPAPARVPR